jgi:O-antigen/teichoic acid export membrane protein
MGVLFKGTLWVAFGEALAGGASLLAGVVAARLVSPSDFGLMGTVMLAVTVLESLTVSGFEQALVQREKDVEPLLNVAWTWHVLRGFAMALVLSLSAGLLARFYSEPRLTGLLVVSSVSVVLYGFQNIGTVSFTRQLDFRTEFAIKVGQALFSTVIFVPAVLILRSTWALAIGYVGGAVAKFVISYVAQPFRPRFEWDREKLRQLFGFGKWITGMTPRATTSSSASTWV